MKISILIIPLHLLLWTLPGTAQDSSVYILTDYETRDTVSRYIHQLRKNGADTVIRFDLPPTHATSDTALEFSHLQYPNTSYIFYRTTNKTFVTRYTWSELGGHQTYEDLYGPLELPGDTLFDWFSRHVVTIQHDPTSSFITEKKENGKQYYFRWRPLHSEDYRITFFTPVDQFFKRFSTAELEKQNRQGMTNINYENNTKTKLYQLFCLLELYCEKIFVESQQVKNPAIEVPSPQWDTIYFTLPLHQAYTDSIAGIGKLILPVVTYTIARSGNKLNTQKTLNTYYNEDYSNRLSASFSWVEVTNDTLLSWLDSRATAIKDEELAPFIFRWNSEDQVHYEEMWTSHPEVYRINVIIAGKKISKWINLYLLEAETRHGVFPNLNYTYNTSLTLYQLYRKLRYYTEAWDSQYVLHTTR